MVDTVTVNRHFTLDRSTFCLALRDGDIDHPVPAVRQVTPEPGMDWDDDYPIDGYDGKLCGLNKDHVALRDKYGDIEHLNRAAVSNYWDPTDLSMYDTLTFGTATCIGITRRTNRLIDNGSSNSYQWPQWEHWLCFHLDTDLVDIDGQGIAIESTATAFPDFSTTLDLENTPCEAIHATTFGVAPGAPKHMQLSAWKPGWGNEGITEFLSADFPYAYLQRADTAAIVSDPYPISRRQDTTIDDENTTTPGDGSYTVLSTTEYWPIDAVSKANPGVLTIDTSSKVPPENGAVVAVQYATGMNDINFFGLGSDYITIAGVTDNMDGTHDITTDRDTSSYDDYAGEGYLYLVIENNYSGTNVYEAEADGFDPADLSLEYRWYIPGLGHSPETFTFDHAHMLEAAKRYYWNWADSFMNGKEKVGPYYQAPRNFSDTDHGPWNFTYCTYYNHTEGGGTVTTIAALSEAWTSVSPPSLPQLPRFNLQDAGDYDVRYQSEWLIEFLILYKSMSGVNFAAVDFGYPSALSQGADATFWAGSDTLPNLMQGAILMFEGLRRLRWPDGEVSAGYNYTPNNMTAQAPSYLNSWDIAVFAPEVISTYQFAGCAALIGVIIKELGQTSLGNAIIAEAEESYARAEEIVATPLDFWVYDWMNTNQNTEWTARSAKLTQTNDRPAAAMYLYGATGDTDYLTVAEASLDARASNRYDRLAAFYHWSLGADGNKGLDFESDIIAEADQTLENSDNCAWPTARGTGSEYRTGSPHSNFDKLVSGWVVTQDQRYLKILSHIADHLFGCNRQNASWSRGLGNRQLRGHLNLDTQYRKEESPAGTTVFGYNNWSQGTLMSVFTHGFGIPGNQYTTLFTYRNQGAGNAVFKQPEPCQWGMPFYDFRIEFRGLVALMEQASEDAIVLSNLMLVLWDGYGKGVTQAGSLKRNIGTWAAGAAIATTGVLESNIFSSPIFG